MNTNSQNLNSEILLPKAKHSPIRHQMDPEHWNGIDFTKVQGIGDRSSLEHLTVSGVRDEHGEIVLDRIRCDHGVWVEKIDHGDQVRSVMQIDNLRIDGADGEVHSGLKDQFFISKLN